MITGTASSGPSGNPIPSCGESGFAGARGIAVDPPTGGRHRKGRREQLAVEIEAAKRTGIAAVRRMSGLLVVKPRERRSLDE